MAIIIALMMVGWAVVEIIFMPEIKEKAIQMASEGLQKRNIPEDQVEQGMAMVRKSYGIFLILGSIFGSLFTGAVCSLIGAAIPKKKGERPFQLDALK
jgi:H+/gluconate symporter-like permease